MSDTTMKIDEQYRNGLKLRAFTNKPKTNMRDYLENLLEKARIPRITEQELTQKLKEMGKHG